MLPTLCVSGEGASVGCVEQATVRIVAAKMNAAFIIVVCKSKRTGKKYITVRSNERQILKLRPRWAGSDYRDPAEAENVGQAFLPVLISPI